MANHTPERVREYYNRFTGKYLELYGEVIQAFRPGRTKDLLKYIANSAGLKKNMRIVDAGCGVCGPAVFFADNYKVHVDAVTISDVQQQEGERRVANARLKEKVRVVCGDYHELTAYFQQGAYDAVLFLESLGHAEDPAKVIREAAALLKPGGFIYIKDFYRKEVDDPEFQARIDQVIHNMNVHYTYNTLRLTPVIEALRKPGLEIDFIRKFAFNDDTSVRAAFESDLKIDIFEGLPEFYPAEWLEIRCVKPFA